MDQYQQLITDSFLNKTISKGLLVSFEGGDGSGKTTQIQILAKMLRSAGYSVILTREPGGTIGAESMRYILLNAHDFKPSPLLEAVLFAAARRDHIEQLIAPSLKEGKIVLCDRYIDSTRVYQGLAGKVCSRQLAFLEKVAIDSYLPDLTLFLDVDTKVGMARAADRRGSQQKADRFEKESLKIQEQRRQKFLTITANEPDRCRVIDANQEKYIIADEIAQVFVKKINEIAS